VPKKTEAVAPTSSTLFIITANSRDTVVKIAPDRNAGARMAKRIRAEPVNTAMMPRM
jgi:hypothetical protein